MPDSGARQPLTGARGRLAAARPGSADGSPPAPTAEAAPLLRARAAFPLLLPRGRGAGASRSFPPAETTAAPADGAEPGRAAPRRGTSAAAAAALRPLSASRGAAEAMRDPPLPALTPLMAAVPPATRSGRRGLRPPPAGRRGRGGQAAGLPARGPQWGPLVREGGGRPSARCLKVNSLYKGRLTETWGFPHFKKTLHSKTL